jgi:hypothetical protein
VAARGAGVLCGIPGVGNVVKALDVETDLQTPAPGRTEAAERTKLRSRIGYPFGGSPVSLGPLKSWATKAIPRCVSGRYDSAAEMPVSPPVTALAEYECWTLSPTDKESAALNATPHVSHA